MSRSIVSLSPRFNFLPDTSRPAAPDCAPRAGGSALVPLSAVAASMLFGLVPAIAAEPVQAAARLDATLPTVTVQGQADSAEKGYQGEKTRIGKVPQLPKDVPQSLSIVADQLMRERNANTFKEALRNVAGLTFNAGEGGRIGDNLTLRGYSAASDLFLDGMRDVAQYNRETFNLEQIDILRGSGSMLFGRGSTGGVINQVSKQALAKDKKEVTLTAGSFNYRRATLDINQVLNQDWALRLNAMHTDSDSFRHEVKQKRDGLAPTLSWRANGTDQVTLSYYFLKDDNLPDYGVPYFQGKPLAVPISRFYGLANADYERNQTGIATIGYTHVFGKDSAVRVTLRQADYERDLRAVAPRLAGTPVAITDGVVINRQRQARGGAEHTQTLQVDFNDQWQWGGMRHEVLAGLEYLHEQASRYSNTSLLANPATTVGSDNARPNLPAGFDASFVRTGYNRYAGHSVSLYGQDTLQLASHWKLLLGTRFDSLRANYQRPLPAGPLERSDQVWSWRSGLMYQPDAFSTWYASYGSSFNPSAEAYQLDSRTANTPPEKSRNFELGFKRELLGGDLSLRTALFRSEKTNERNTDLAQPDVAVLSGRRHTDGAELEVVGKISASWQVFANLALMRARIDQASGAQANTLDKDPINTPHHTWSLWSTYKIAPGWKVGGGLEGVAARYGNATNTVQVPGYSRVDGLLEYGVKTASGQRYEVKLNVFNLLDKTYYESVYAGHVLPGTRRAVQLSLNARF